MAQQVITTYISDISEEEITGDAPTVIFALDGKSYAIDLTAEESEQMMRALEPYVTAAKPAGRAAKTRSSTTASSSNTSDVREWAKGNGFTVPERGRLPKEVQQAYAATH